MTLRTPPSWLQNGSHPAENDRLTTQALWATTGIIKSNSLEVTPNSPVGMSVIIASGWAAIVGTTQSNMGTYVAYNDASTVVAITTANPTNPRIDLVCVTVQDAYYTGSSNNVVFQVVAGTPASSPVAPATPANSIALATVDVAAGALSITSGDITDLRVMVTTNIPESGDISSVTAGNGLSGGGSSGAVTLAIDTSITADLSTAQTLSNKTLTSPKINLGINTQIGTTYTTVLADNGKIVTLNNSSPITVTLPLNSSVAYPVGAQLTFTSLGTGTVTVVGDSGVTVVSTGLVSSSPTLRTQYSTGAAIQLSADNWIVMGDIA